MLANAHRLGESVDKVIWAGAGLADQLSIAWVLALARHFGVDESRLYVVQFERLGTGQVVLSTGELSADRIRESSPGAAQIVEVGISEYDKAWAAYTSNDPADLSRYLKSPTQSPVLHRAMRSLVLRYPDKQSGISYCDELILKYTCEKGPLAARVVGYAMGFNESMDNLGDSYVFSRVVRLSQKSLNAPLLQLSGDAKVVRLKMTLSCPSLRGDVYEHFCEEKSFLGCNCRRCFGAGDRGD